jgi:hypothetical protein
MLLLGMKNSILILAITFSFMIGHTSCSKPEKIIIEKGTKKDTGNVIIRKMFIGVHARTVTYPTVFDLIVGYTNSDSSFTQTDSIRGPFLISSSLDKHTSTMSLAKKELYFIYKHATSGNLLIGIVNTSTGKYSRSIDLGIPQTDMIHLQYDEQDSKLYFSMSTAMYQVNETNGSLSNVKQQQNSLELPKGYPNGDYYLSHLIGSKKLIYVKNNSSILFYDRNTLTWDSMSLPPSGSYRSLIASPDDENTLYSYNLVGNTNYNLVKINLSNKTSSNTVSQNSFCHILWFQARFHPAHALYSCLPYEHQMFPYFITINVVTGETIKYTTPSHLGQCLLD